MVIWRSKIWRSTKQMYKKNIVEKNISQKFKLKNINETRNYFIEEINQN